MNLKAKLLVSFLLIGFLSASPVGADSPTVADVSKELMCQCPECTMVLETCDCGFADGMRLLIGEMIDEGKTKQQIVDYFVAQYGEKVLAVPTKKGFNMIVWVLPFGALVFGGGAIYVVLRAWVRHGRSPQIDSVAPAEEEDDEYRERLEEELDQFTEDGFR